MDNLSSYTNSTPYLTQDQRLKQIDSDYESRRVEIAKTFEIETQVIHSICVLSKKLWDCSEQEGKEIKGEIRRLYNVIGKPIPDVFKEPPSPETQQNIPAAADNPNKVSETNQAAVTSVKAPLVASSKTGENLLKGPNLLGGKSLLDGPNLFRSKYL